MYERIHGDTMEKRTKKKKMKLIHNYVRHNKFPDRYILAFMKKKKESIAQYLKTQQ